MKWIIYFRGPGGSAYRTAECSEAELIGAKEAAAMEIEERRGEAVGGAAGFPVAERGGGKRDNTGGGGGGAEEPAGDV